MVNFCCYLCNTNIPPNKNIYYANDCTYCSISCRYNSICIQEKYINESEINRPAPVIENNIIKKSYKSVNNLDLIDSSSSVINTTISEKKNTVTYYDKYDKYDKYDNYSRNCNSYLKYSISFIIYIYTSLYK